MLSFPNKKKEEEEEEFEPMFVEANDIPSPPPQNKRKTLFVKDSQAKTSSEEDDVLKLDDQESNPERKRYETCVYKSVNI